MQNNAETKRLLLQILTVEDHEFITALVNTEGWIKFIGDRNVHSQAQAVAYIHKILDSPYLYYWVVRTKEGSIPIGIISFMKREYLEHFDIGFAFLREFQGNGYAYEAANTILSLVRLAKEYTKVLATTVPGNINSIKLLTTLGFRFEKELEVANKILYIYSNS